MSEWTMAGGFRVVRVGISHASLWALIDRNPEAPQDKRERWDLFSMIVLAGSSCVKTWSETEEQ